MPCDDKFMYFNERMKENIIIKTLEKEFHDELIQNDWTQCLLINHTS